MRRSQVISACNSADTMRDALEMAEQAWAATRR
jgi:hypothetical protein